MLAKATVVGTMVWLCILQAKDKHGSLGNGHAGRLSLQPQALIQDLQAQPEDCQQDAQPSHACPPAGRASLCILLAVLRLCLQI